MFHVKQIDKNMIVDQIKKDIRNVPNFPMPGIQFKDITSILSHPNYLKWIQQQTAEHYADYGITKVVGLESRGFMMGPAIALELNAGFAPIRKPGKLPWNTVSVTYSKEYGEDRIEIHKDSLCEDDVVLLHDDLLATGGTMEAAIKLVRQLGVKKIYTSFIIELDDLKGRELLKDVEVFSLIHF